MASVKVAVRARPLNQRELDMQSRLIIEMNGNKTTITNTKISSSGVSVESDVGRERVKEFTYDFSYWSCSSSDPHFATQEQVLDLMSTIDSVQQPLSAIDFDNVFDDLGKEVVENSFEGYNACIFAYGQTGSGKTFTMMGTPDSEGLIPRICQSLFSRMKQNIESGTKFRTEVSYLEIYNERVKDLLRKNSSQHNLKVREHPKLGPYVQDLSHHYVMDYSDVQELMARGNSNRTTAATAMNDVSSRSHAIFTLSFTQAKFHQDMPSETVSKVNLVDLAGSERADASGATGQRLKEGGHINKSLVTLGSVISALADIAGNPKRQIFIPYRDSVLTWLLKDSLGGNSKTIMIATISPAECNYGESLSTLRYASRAKSIINRPTINEDPNVKLIRDLRAEIEYLKSMLQGSVKSSPQVMEKLQENEARVKLLTDQWAEKWREIHKILKEQQTLALRKSGAGVVLDSEQPHLIGLDDDVLSTGITLYHLKEGVTSIGRSETANKQDIELQGDGIEDEHCFIEQKNGIVTLIPLNKAHCSVNTIQVDRPLRLMHGCVILLGSSSMFRFNDPAEVQRLRKEKTKRSSLHSSRLSLFSQSLSDLAQSVDDLNSSNTEQNDKAVQALEEKRRHLEELEMEHRLAEEKRRKEQEKFEAEMEEKRLQLEKLKKDSEDMQKQVLLAQHKVEEEQRKLQRRSQDVEKQFQLYLQEKSKLEAEKMQVVEVTQAAAMQMTQDLLPYDLFKARLSDLTRRKTELEWQREETLLQAEIEAEQLRVLETDFKRVYQRKVQELSSFLSSLQDSQFRKTLLEHYENQTEEFPNLEACARQFRNQVKRDLSKQREELEKTLAELQSQLQNANTPEKSDSLNLAVAETTEQLKHLSEEELVVDQSFFETMKYANQGNLSEIESAYTSLVAKRESLLQTQGLIKSQNKMIDGLSSKLKDVELEIDLPIIRDREIMCSTPSSGWNDDSSNISKQRHSWHWDANNEEMDSSLLKDSKDKSSLNEYNRRIEELQDLENQFKEIVSEIEGGQILFDELQFLEPDGDLRKCLFSSPHLRNNSFSSLDSQPLRPNHLQTLQALDNGDFPARPRRYSEPSRNWNLPKDSPEYLMRGSASRRTESLSDHSPQDAQGVQPIPCLIAIPSYTLRGTGSSSHYEYEIKIALGMDQWTIYRRYKRFRELHHYIKQKYEQVKLPYFPPRKLFGSKSEKVVQDRQKHLESYLRLLFATCFKTPGTPISKSSSKHLGRQNLYDLAPFFRKGCFESTKHATG